MELENCKWYIYNNSKRIFVQKLLGEWHYWEFESGWHPLTEMVRNWLKLDDNQN